MCICVQRIEPGAEFEWIQSLLRGSLTLVGEPLGRKFSSHSSTPGLS